MAVVVMRMPKDTASPETASVLVVICPIPSNVETCNRLILACIGVLKYF